jgi:hypothetical protein
MSSTLVASEETVTFDIPQAAGIRRRHQNAKFANDHIEFCNEKDVKK